MKCKYCGSEMKEESKFCPQCGSPAEARETQEEDSPALPKRKKRKRGPAFTALLIVSFALSLTILGAGFGVFYYFNQKKLEDVYQTSQLLEMVSRPKEADIPEESQEEKEPEEKDADAAAGGETADGDGTADADGTDDTAGVAASQPGTRRYEVVIGDYTWNEAYAAAKESGGRLACFNNLEEYQQVLDTVLNNPDYKAMKLWIGGVRTADSEEYHWANTDGTVSAEVINTQDYSGVWMEGQPSYSSQGDAEYFVMMRYDNWLSRWGWDDGPDDLTVSEPSNRGRIGYICEFES